MVEKCHTLGTEMLEVAGMVRAGLQTMVLADAGISSLLDRIRYKAQWYGTCIVEADQWYPSSKTCSACGVVNRKLGREPRWSCPGSGVSHDLKENVARNLQKLGLVAVGEDVMLLDGKALAGGGSTADETTSKEGRTNPSTGFNTRLRLACTHYYSFGLPFVIQSQRHACPPERSTDALLPVAEGADADFR